MEYRTLGKTDLKISRLGLGGIPIQHSSPQEVAGLLGLAREAGINFIDTARGYTVSEELLGSGLKGHRDKWVLASKSMQRTKAGILQDVHTTLKNLRTDYLDLYQIHNIRTEEDWKMVMSTDGALAGLEQAKKEGLIRHIGVTAHSADMMNKALDAEHFNTMMFPYNVVERHNKDLFEKANKFQIGTLAMKPLAGGFIQDANKALRYLASDSNLDCLLVGMDSPEQIKNNIQALAEGPLNDAELAELSAWADKAGNDFCRRCGYCLPCPQGIDIPSVFLFEGYYDRYELKGWAKERYAALSVKADACKTCGQCKERCPYSLPIPEKLAKAAKKLI